MKSAKRFISFIIAALMCLGMLSVSAESTANRVTYGDENHYEILIAIGVIDETINLYSPKGYVSRAGLVKTAIDISFGRDISLTNMGDNPYMDIKDDTNFKDEILLAHKIGLISKDTLFRPDDNVLYIEAVKILVGALGYSLEANRNGGFPTGYLNMANSIGLTKNIKSDYYAPLDFATFYKLIYNAVRCDITDVYNIIGYGEDAVVSYAKVEGKNLLGSVFGVYETEGVVTANKYATLTGASTVKSDIVKVDGEMYQAGKMADTVGTLGYSVQAFYSYDKATEEKTVLYLEPSERLNVTLTLTEANWADGSDANRIYYYENDKLKNIRVSRTASMIYNNGWITFDETKLYPHNGTVTIIDNNNDNMIDVIKVMDYETVIVGTVLSDDGIISSALGGNGIIMDKNDEEYDFVLLKNGKKLDIDNISQYNVISYAESASGKIKLKTVIVSSDHVKGTAEGYVNGRVLINGKAYYMTDYMRENIKLGSVGTFYLDTNGKVAFQESESGILFGYFNNIMQKTEMGVTTVFAQIFSEHGRFTEIELAERINYNGDIKTAVEFYTEVNADLQSYRQLVEFKVNQNDMLVAINYAETVTLGEEDEREARRKGTFRLSKSMTSATYRSNGFDDYLKIGSHTKVFFVPDQSSGNADLSEFYIGGLKNEISYSNLKMYNMDSFLVPDVIVITESDSSLRYETTTYIINDIVTMINDDGQVVTGVECWRGGEKYTYPVYNDPTVITAISSLGTGDIGRFAFNNGGEIKGFTQWYDASAPFAPSSVGSAYGTSTAYATAEVIEVDHQNKRMILNYNGYRVGTYSTPTVYIYNKTADRITLGKITDVKKGTKLFTTYGYLSLGTMMIITE